MYLNPNLWEEINSYLFFDIKLSRKPQAKQVIFSRFNKVLTHFVSNNIEFNRRNFVAYLAKLDEEGYLKKGKIEHYKPSYLNNLLKTAKHIDKFLGINQIQDFKYEKENYDIPKDTLTVEELQRLIETDVFHRRWSEFYTKRNRALIGVFAETGGRITEILELRWQDIVENSDGRYVIFTETKSGKSREVPVVNEGIWNTLMDLPRTSELVFTSYEGKKIDGPSVREMLKKRAKAAGITKYIWPHLLRHTWGKLAANGNMNMFTQQKIMGHENPAITARYANIDLKQKTIAMSTHPINRGELSKERLEDIVRQQVKEILAGTEYRLEWAEGTGEAIFCLGKRISFERGGEAT